jgi:hypothetical protein
MLADGSATAPVENGAASGRFEAGAGSGWLVTVRRLS